MAMRVALGVRCLRSVERSPTGRVAARFSHPSRELWLAAGGGSNPRVTMTTDGITRLLLTEGERERGCLRGAVAARRRCELHRWWRATEGPLMDSPVRPYVWPSNRYTRIYTLSAGRRAEGGSINNSLAEPSISPRRYDQAVDRPRDYIRLRSWFPIRGKISAVSSWGFLGSERAADLYRGRRYVSPEISLNAIVEELNA
jgi:hypothetical protein